MEGLQEFKFLSRLFEARKLPTLFKEKDLLFFLV